MNTRILISANKLQGKLKISTYNKHKHAINVRICPAHSPVSL